MFKGMRVNRIVRQGGMTFNDSHFYQESHSGQHSLGKAFPETSLLLNLKWPCRCSSVSWTRQSEGLGVRGWKAGDHLTEVSPHPRPLLIQRLCKHLMCERWLPSLSAASPMSRASVTHDWHIQIGPTSLRLSFLLLIFPDCQTLSTSGLPLILTFLGSFCFALSFLSDVISCLFKCEVFSSTLSCFSSLLFFYTQLSSSSVVTLYPGFY